MFKSILILVLAMVSIQFSASQAKQLFPLVGIAGTSALRLFFASIIMCAWFKPWQVKFNKSLLYYGASLGLMNFSFYFALQRIPLGIGVALEFLGPLSVAIFTSKNKVDYVWAVLAGIGIFLLLPNDVSAQSLDPIGMGLAILAGLFWALYIVFGKKAGNDIKGGVAASWGMLVAALIVLPFGIGLDGAKMLNTSALPLTLMVAVFGSALPYSLEMIALKNMPSRTFGILMSLEPALAAVMGLIFLAEQLTWNQWAAILCVIISSAGSTLSSKK